MRSFTAQIAGYSVPVTSWSIRSVKLVMVAASVITPIAARPRLACATRTALWAITTPAPVEMNRGTENSA